ncbi:AaceriADR067Wp [[Ashbya] aceris (nom. inval.)]|nr:AaceriADR067Wp [[Ashbya] aceris (nom. inval.)]
MDGHLQGAEDLLEELLKQAQSESNDAESGAAGAGYAQHDVKQRQESVVSQLADDGAFLDEYFLGGGDGLFADTLLPDLKQDDGGRSPLGSSLGSVTSEFLSPAGSVSQPQRLGSLESGPQSLRSPSASARAGAHLSSSLRSQARARQSSLSSLASTPVLEDGAGSLTQEEKLRRRREFHNAVERRRRELIKSKIKELGKLVPPSLLNYNDEGKEVRLNKGIILLRTVEYLEYLRQVLDVQARKRAQLLEKLHALERRRRDLPPLRPAPAPCPRPSLDSPEQIIDGRALPQLLKDEPPPLADDLRQFLAGPQMEHEDNSKLIFSAASEHPAGFLLNFEP